MWPRTPAVILPGQDLAHDHLWCSSPDLRDAIACGFCGEKRSGASRVSPRILFLVRIEDRLKKAIVERRLEERWSRRKPSCGRKSWARDDDTRNVHGVALAEIRWQRKGRP